MNTLRRWFRIQGLKIARWWHRLWKHEADVRSLNRSLGQLHRRSRSRFERTGSPSVESAVVIQQKVAS